MLKQNFAGGCEYIQISGLAIKLGHLSGLSVGKLCSLAEPAKVSLALDSAHLPTEEEGWRAGLGV